MPTALARPQTPGRGPRGAPPPLLTHILSPGPQRLSLCSPTLGAFPGRGLPSHCSLCLECSPHLCVTPSRYPSPAQVSLSPRGQPRRPCQKELCSPPPSLSRTALCLSFRVLRARWAFTARGFMFTVSLVERQPHESRDLTCPVQCCLPSILPGGGA